MPRRGHWLKEILLNPLIMATAGCISWAAFEDIYSSARLPSLSGLLLMDLIAVVAGLTLQSLNRHQGTYWYGVIVKLLVLSAIARGWLRHWSDQSVFPHRRAYGRVAGFDCVLKRAARCEWVGTAVSVPPSDGD